MCVCVCVCVCGGGGGATPTLIRFFQSFAKTIYSKRLKLSVAVHSSSAEILMSIVCLSFFSLPWQLQISCRVGEK